MRDAVAEGRGRDAAAFRFMDVEMAIRAWLVRFAAQIILQFVQICLLVVLERGDGLRAAFAAPRVAIRPVQIFKITHLVVQMLVRFHLPPCA